MNYKQKSFSFKFILNYIFFIIYFSFLRLQDFRISQFFISLIFQFLYTFNSNFQLFEMSNIFNFNNHLCLMINLINLKYLQIYLFFFSLKKSYLYIFII